MGKIFEKGVIGGWDINGKIYDRAVVEEYFLPDYIHKDKLQKVVEELEEKIEFDMKSPDDNRHFSLLKLHEEAIQKLNKLLK